MNSTVMLRIVPPTARFFGAPSDASGAEASGPVLSSVSARLNVVLAYVGERTVTIVPWEEALAFRRSVVEAACEWPAP